MESLDGTTWDVVIAGTGLQQSLLALSLSRSNLKILHLDRNDYYGGAEAAFSLQEARAWVKRVNSDTSPHRIFSDASIEEPEIQGNAAGDDGAATLSFSRAYSLALAPQLIYARSDLLPKLVSSKVYRQLEFLAVGSWFTFEPQSATTETATRTGLKRIPSSREDVFQDVSLDLNGRRRLMKFLRFIGEYGQQHERGWENPSSPLHTFPDFLAQKFGIPQTLQSPIVALTLSLTPPKELRTEDALHNITLHLQSIGIFGRGFGSVIPKWGGLCEIAQVGCRAAAVGGATYVLDKPVVAWHPEGEESIKMKLKGGESITTKWLAGCDEDLALEHNEQNASHVCQTWCHSISIVGSPLGALFPATAEGSPAPAGAVVYHSPNNDGPAQQDASETSPVYLQVHSGDTGECPVGQSVIYASVLVMAAEHASTSLAIAHDRLRRTVSDLLVAASDIGQAHVLWSLKYSKREMLGPPSSDAARDCTHLVRFPATLQGVDFKDAMIERVQRAWKTIRGDETNDGEFLVFEDREVYASADDEDGIGLMDQ